MTAIDKNEKSKIDFLICVLRFVSKSALKRRFYN